jgi:hypothetical protein
MIDRAAAHMRSDRAPLAVSVYDHGTLLACHDMCEHTHKHPGFRRCDY